MGAIIWMFLVVLVVAAALVVVALPLHLVVYLVLRIKGKHDAEDTSALTTHFIYAAVPILIFAAIVIAIPNFRKYESRYPQSEAKTNLGAIYVAQLSYFSNNNTYASGPEAFKLMNWEPAGQNRYAYFCGDQEIENKLPAKGVGIPSLQQIESMVSVRPQSSKAGFTCMAVGNIDNDPDLDVWSINDGKILRNDQNDKKSHFFGLWKE